MPSVVDDMLLAEAVFRCEVVAQVRLTGPWMPVKHRALSDKLYVVTGGSGWLTVDRARYRLRPNRVYTIPAGSVHAGESDARRPLEKRYVHFRGLTAGSLPLLRMAPPPVCVAGKTAAALIRLADEMGREWAERAGAYTLALNGLISQAVLMLYRAPRRDHRRADEVVAHPEAAAVNDEQYDAVKRVLSRVLSGYHEPLDLHALAEAVGWTPGHLSRVFHRLTGQPPRRFIESVRMNHARERLAGGEDAVSAIARAVGYDDPNYFSRAFQRCVGVSPTAYRDAMRPQAR